MILPGSAEAYLDGADVTDMDAAQLRLARNEIFARHGYVFSSEDLATYFAAQAWYEPAANNDAIALSDIETANVQMLQVAEARARTFLGGETPVPVVDGDMAMAWSGRIEWDYQWAGNERSSGEGYFIGQGNHLREGALDADRFVLIREAETTWVEMASLEGGGSEGFSYAMQLALPSVLERMNLVTIESRSAEREGEALSVLTVNGYAYPEIMLDLDQPGADSEAVLERGMLLSRSVDSYGSFLFEVPGGWVVQPYMTGELWVTEDGIVVQADLTGFMTAFDYDHFVFEPFDLRYRVSDLERRSDVSSEAFDPDLSAIETWNYAG